MLYILYPTACEPNQSSCEQLVTAVTIAPDWGWPDRASCAVDRGAMVRSMAMR